MQMTRTERILDHAHNAVISMDEAGVGTYWNPAAETPFGFARSEALGRPVAELIIPDRLRAAHWSGLRRFLAEGRGKILDRRGGGSRGWGWRAAVSAATASTAR